MADSLAGVVLAAGAGTRLRPLTAIRPKALCPVDNVPLVDLAVARAEDVTDSVAVNVHHGLDLMESHLAGRVHLSIEEERALGTAGALGALHDWIEGRPTLVVNSDAWFEGGIGRLVDGWDRERIRLMVVRAPGHGDFGPLRYAGVALMPWADVGGLAPEPAGLYEASWRAAEVAGRLDLVVHDGPWFDCGTPATYLAANLAASGGRSVIGPGAIVDGEVHEGVVWPHSVVRKGEVLRRAIRAGEQITVCVR